MIHCATNEPFTHLCKVIGPGLALPVPKEGFLSTARVATGHTVECSSSVNADGGAHLM